jgi:hypothetical protein
VANKTLSQVIGASNHEIGDIIHTTASTLADGRVLLECNGALITPASYPLLEAELTTGEWLSLPYVFRNNNDDKFNFTDKWEASVTNDRFVGLEKAGTERLSYLSPTAQSGTGYSNERFGGVCMSDDGSVCFAAYIDETSAHLEIKYNEASAAPATNKVISTAGYNDGGTTTYPCECIQNPAGTVAKVFASNGTNVYVWTSPTSNLGGTWTNTSTTAAASGTGVRYHPSRPAYKDDLTYIVLATDFGAWVSTDSGATWTTEDSLLPDNNYPFGVAINSSLDIYACSSAGVTNNIVYKSTDDAATWTVFFDLASHFPDMPYWMSDPEVVSVSVDSSDNIYIFVYLTGNGASSSDCAVALYYSTDDGVTWAVSYRYGFSHAAGASTNYAALRTYQAAVDKDGGTFRYRTGNGDALIQYDLTSGVFLPTIPGHKIVADAP